MRTTDATAVIPQSLLTAQQAATMLAISPRKLWTMTNLDQVPHVRMDRSVRYPVKALQEWIEKQTKGVC